MRGQQKTQGFMLAFVDLEERVPPDHPLRTVKRLADEVLRELSPAFDAMYATIGRPSIPPERLLKASVLIALYSARSERQFCEDLDYNLLYRWFLDMQLLEPSFDPTSFTKNRRRLLDHEIGRRFFDEVVELADALDLLSDEHFTVDGTLIEAAASLKSFRPRAEPPGAPPDDPGNPSVDFRGERRRNDTHQSTTDPESRLARKGPGKEARLSYGACPDGEPAWLAFGLPGDASNRHRRAGYGGGPAGPCLRPGLPSEDARGRPRVRHQRLCGEYARAKRHTPCDPEHQRAAERD
jgi:transposase